MINDTVRANLQNQLQHQYNDLNNFHAENTRLQADYSAGTLHIQQLEQQLGDMLYYQRNILENMQEAERLVSGKDSRLGGIQFVRQGQLEGRFLERIQARITEQ